MRLALPCGEDQLERRGAGDAWLAEKVRVHVALPVVPGSVHWAHTAIDPRPAVAFYSSTPPPLTFSTKLARRPAFALRK